MAKDIEDYVRSCEDCQKNIASRHKRHGVLHPLELSYAPWDAISMDFITQLPKSDGCSTGCVIVDRFTKMAHFVPVKDEQKTAESCAKLFLENIGRPHGLPSSIISDRDPVFTSKFWAELIGRLDVQLRKSTAFHHRLMVRLKGPTSFLSNISVSTAITSRTTGMICYH